MTNHTIEYMATCYDNQGKAIDKRIMFDAVSKQDYKKRKELVKFADKLALNHASKNGFAFGRLLLVDGNAA